MPWASDLFGVAAGAAKEWLMRNGLSISIPFRWTGFRNDKMSNYKWFDDSEIVGLEKELCAMLDMAREIAGVPFVITCGLRTVGKNSILNGAVADSAHLTGLAVDLAVADDHSYFCMLKGLYAAGFRRFGHYFAYSHTDPNDFIPRHLHVDIDISKPQDCAWAKREQN